MEVLCFGFDGRMVSRKGIYLLVGSETCCPGSTEVNFVEFYRGQRAVGWVRRRVLCRGGSLCEIGKTEEEDQV